jgi:hypothetical protein
MYPPRRSFSTAIFLILLANMIRESFAVDYNFDKTYAFWDFTNFNSWSELNSLTTARTMPGTSTAIRPRTPIILTSQFNLAQLVISTDYASCNPSYPFYIYMLGLKGIDAFPWPTNYSIPLNTDISSITLQVDESLVEFYMNGNVKISDQTCSRNAVPYVNKTGSFFSYFRSVVFSSKVKYQKSAICPYVFENALLTSLALQGLYNSVGVTNLWQFDRLEMSESTINSSIQYLEIQGYRVGLDSTLIHPLVFQSLVNCLIQRSVGSVATAVFKSLKHLAFVQLDLDSLVNFFHSTGNVDWSTNLPTSAVVTFSRFDLFDDENGFITNWINGPSYSYPDRDFCIFANWPHAKSTLPILDSDGLTECTNTIKWLVSNYGRYSFTTNLFFTNNSITIYEKCQKSTFDNKTLLCENGSLNNSSYLYPETYEIGLIVSFIDNIIVFVFLPVACIIGFLLNWRVIKTVQQNDNKELKDELYKYMSVNSKFNCIYCLVLVFYPVNVCLDYNNYDMFCSSINRTLLAQLYKIVAVAYLGGVLKMCSNICYIFMTLNRYMLIGKDHPPLLCKISKLDFTRVVQVAVVVSGLFNIGNVFEYGINNGHVFELGSFYDIYPLQFITSKSTFNSGFSIYEMVDFAINFVCFLVVNTSLEISIVCRLHAELGEKRRRMAEMSSLDEAKRKMKMDQDRKSENRAICMVVMNGIVNFALRVPEVFLFLYISFSFLFYEILNSVFIFVDTFYLFYVLTFSTNVLVFYFFNKKFKEAFCLYGNANEAKCIKKNQT